jgi:MtN3 and saliva related transmembrane protein
MTEAIGWISSIILVITIAKQVYKQWSEGTSEGVSIWLFVGQLAASIGFAIYSFLVWNPVFIFTNSLMVLNGIAGLSISIYQKKRDNQL